MPKKVLGTGGKHRANSPTSVRMLRLARRRAEALEHRLRGDSFATIAAKMRINISTAHDYIVRSLESVAPTREARQAALELELQRLDQLQAAVSAAAAKGDVDAIKSTLSIMRLRGRYLGLLPDGRQGGVNVNIGGEPSPAERFGITVRFVKGRWVDRADGTSVWHDGPLTEPPALPPPAPLEPEPTKPAFGPNVLKFR